jgi:hypothetical protein
MRGDFGDMGCDPDGETWALYNKTMTNRGENGYKNIN